MFKKMIAVILSAVMAASCFTASACAQQLETATVMQEYGATAVRWNGKTQLKAGKTYAVTSNVTISGKVTIPAGTTLIVMKNAKLWVSSKGSLYIKGKLNIRSGSTLAVTGGLYLYKGASLLNYGETRFSDKSVVTLNGKTTVYASGSIAGSPKKLSVGSNADVVCKGKNSCQKLNSYIERTAIETKLDGFFTRAIQKSDIYGAMKSAMSAEYIADIDKSLAAMGITFEQFCNSFGDEYKLALGENNIDPETIKSIDVKITDMDREAPEEELAEIAEIYYSNADKCYEIECEVTIKTAASTYTEEAEVTVVLQNGKCYLLG